MHSQAKTQSYQAESSQQDAKKRSVFHPWRFASARIPTRNTSCNDVGGATRSVAGGTLREKVSLIPLLVLGSRSARFSTCSRGTQTLQPRGIGRRPTLLLIRSQDRIDVVDILTVQGLSFLSLGRTNERGVILQCDHIIDIFADDCRYLGFLICRQRSFLL